jgi:hypothetical protein
VSVSERLRVLFVCAALELGALSGIPMRPEDIQNLMRQMNEAAVAHVLPADDDEGGGLPRGEAAMPGSRAARSRDRSSEHEP